MSLNAPYSNVVNEICKPPLLKNCAIGGGIAVQCEIEPVLPYDFDIICAFPESGMLVDSVSVFESLKRADYLIGWKDRVENEGIAVPCRLARIGAGSFGARGARDHQQCCNQNLNR